MGERLNSCQNAFITQATFSLRKERKKAKIFLSLGETMRIILILSLFLWNCGVVKKIWFFTFRISCWIFSRRVTNFVLLWNHDLRNTVWLWLVNKPDLGCEKFLFTKILVHTFPDADIFKRSAKEIGAAKEYARELDLRNYELLEALPEYYSRCKGHPT